MSLEDGSLKWQSEIEEGALIAADGKLIVVGKRGKLYIAEADPTSFEEISSTQAITMSPAVGHGAGYRREHSCWTNPVLSHGDIYVKSSYGEMVCIDASRRAAED
jgi:hypothetical protein